MEREKLIKKWLDHNLSPEEQKTFERLEDYDQLTKMSSAIKSFKAPEFSVENTFNNLKSNLKPKEKNSRNWIKPLMRIAAVLAIGFSVYYYSTTLDSNFETTIAQQTVVELPDASTVDLNSNSTLSFNKSDWKTNREVKLDGEAFFKVAKGKKFDVITEDGIVTVLGTQFNVKQRGSYFEVTCYEGLVQVTYDNASQKLKPGYTFKVIDGKQFAEEKEVATQPSWLRGETNFTNVPLKYVFLELENQYDLKVDASTIDTSRLFAGSFTHKNLDLALKSITIPLHLSYSKSGKSITIKRE